MNEVVRHHRWTVRRALKVEPWRVVTHLRLFRGNGLANFEFEFRFGFPRHSRNAAKQILEMLSDEPDCVPPDRKGSQ